MNERAHARFGPSSSARWLNCPASIRLAEENEEIIKRIEARKDNSAAEEGTLAHAALESVLLGTPLPEGVDEVMLEHVKWAASIIKSIPAKYAHVEHRVSLNADCWGTADCIIFATDQTLHVIDFKYGRHQVHAEENTQLGLYAVMAWPEKVRAAKVMLHILQPRIERGGEERRVHSCWEAPKRWLEGLSSKAKQAISLVNSKPAMGDWCQYCPAKGFCPAQHKEVEEAFGAIELKDTPLVEMAKILAKRKQIDDWFDAAEKALLTALEEDGESVPGYRIKLGTKKRIYNPDLTLPDIKALFEEMGIEEKLFVKQEEKLLPLKAVFERVSEEELRGKQIIVDQFTRPTVVLDDSKDFTPLVVE